MRNPKSASELGFTGYDKTWLQKAMQSVNDKRTFMRLKSVWLFASGVKVADTARIIDKSRRMKQMGLRCKRPRYVYSEKDPNRTQKKRRLSESQEGYRFQQFCFLKMKQYCGSFLFYEEHGRLKGKREGLPLPAEMQNGFYLVSLTSTLAIAL